MRIGEVARRAGVGVETVRYYERRGLIARPRSPQGGGVRSYPPETVDRIRFVRRAQGLGFSLREIAELLSLRAEPAADCADVRRRAEAKRAEVDARITELAHIRAALDRLIDACPGEGALRACTILEALESSPAPAVTDEKNRGDEAMTQTRKIEIFSAGCPACEEAIARIRDLACPSCEVAVLDMKDAEIAERAKALGIRSVPAVAIDGKLADCCAGRGPDEATLRAAVGSGSAPAPRGRR